MAPRTDRKLAAILAADVVGYSRLVGDDETGTIARLKALRKEFIEPLIAEYHGRVVKLMGDGALVEFASAVDAVECAVATQKGVADREAAVPENRRLAFRIGINVGDIIVEDGDILGDGVNVAARLEALAEPGGICIARNVYNQVKNKLAFGFEPMGEHRVKNIAEPVTVYRINLSAPGRTRRRQSVWTQRRWQAAAAVVVLLVVGAPGAWYVLWRPVPESMTAEGAAIVPAAAEKPRLPLPDKPSIAVLPFDNLSDEERYERLADGITEDIITDLSRFRDLFVIARNSTLVYKDKPTDIRQIARELGVQYVLEGSLQTDGDRIRITAQLVDATTGNHVWSERYDRPLDDVFAIQGEVTQAIAASLGGFHGTVARAGREVARRKPPQNLQAYDYYLLGVDYKHRFTEEDLKIALEMFRKALDLDPRLARVYVGLAWAYEVQFSWGWAKSRTETMKNFLAAAQTAVALDPLDGEAHLTLGVYYAYNGELEKSLAEVEEALALNANNADVLANSAFILPWLGKPELAVEVAERAVRLNPHHPDYYYDGLRDGYFHVRQFQKALDASRRFMTPAVRDYIFRPLIHAQLDQEDQAAVAKAKLLEYYPDYSAERWLSEGGAYAREAELNLFLDSNRKAGLPICATEAQLAKYPDMKRLEQCEQQRAKS